MRDLIVPFFCSAGTNSMISSLNKSINKSAEYKLYQIDVAQIDPIYLPPGRKQYMNMFYYFPNISISTGREYKKCWICTMRLFEHRNTTTTLTNLLARRKQKQKKKNERLLNLRKYNVVCMYRKRQHQYIYIQLPLQIKI